MMYQTMVLAFSVVLAAPLIASAAAGGDLSSGAEIVHHGASSGIVPCVVCHGSRLQGNDVMGAPALAGAPQAQTLAALAAIAAGRIGTNHAMQNDARLLTKPQQRAIADYLRSLSKQPTMLRALAPNRSAPAGITVLSMGSDILQFGTSSGVKPCSTCHGSLLQGNPATSAPALASEPEGKTLAALNAMAADTSGKNDAMRKIARLLTPAQREAVAAVLELVTPVKR